MSTDLASTPPLARAEAVQAPRRSPKRARSFERTIRDMTLIVASILIAFALDRWWESARERAEERRYLEALEREFSANRGSLGESLKQLAGVDRAVRQLLRLTGPRPPAISGDSLAALFDYSFRFSVVELPSGSLQALLASGKLSVISDEHLRASLAGWPALLSRARTDAELLVQNREDMLKHLDTLMPTLSIARNAEGTATHTRFPINAAVVLADQRVEGYLGNREVRLYNVVVDHRHLMAKADTIIDLIAHAQR